uniref:Uncharacterized protein n=1 Tax=Glossina palpalis gambiensis TaxID=67801 RepID=A0A1B0BVJ7_9MUSC
MLERLTYRTMLNLKVVVFSIILVAHYCLASPIPEGEAAPSFSEDRERIAQLIKGDYNKDLLSAKDEFILSIANDTKNFFEYFYQRSVKVSEDVLADTEVTNNEDQNVKEFVKNLTEHLEEAKSAADIEQKLSSFVHFYKLMERFDTEDLKSPTKIDILIEGYLNKHGLDKFDEEFKKLCHPFLKQFIEKAEEVKKTLDERDLKKYSNFIEVIENLNEHLTIELKGKQNEKKPDN